MLITKGDLLEQETKIARSGMAGHFAHVEIVSDKTVESYRNLLSDRGVATERFLMVGNSIRSDILPVLELGGQAAYVPYHVTWAHEVVTDTALLRRDYHELGDIRELPALLEGLQASPRGGQDRSQVRTSERAHLGWTAPPMPRAAGQPRTAPPPSTSRPT